MSLVLLWNSLSDFWRLTLFVALQFIYSLSISFILLQQNRGKSTLGGRSQTTFRRRNGQAVQKCHFYKVETVNEEGVGSKKEKKNQRSLRTGPHTILKWRKWPLEFESKWSYKFKCDAYCQKHSPFLFFVDFPE